VIASTSYPGLTSSEIGRLLAMRGFRDVIPDGTKWRRLEAAMQTQQQHDHAANCLIRFITDAMEPSRYVDDPNRFSALRDGLTEALALVGLKVNEQGKVARAQVAKNLDEVARLAGRLQTELHRRGVHDQVIFYCQEELIRKSLFHAVFEATKGLAARLRRLSGSALDGSELVDYCFASKTGTPVIRINSYVSVSDKSEHSGFANHLRGVFGAFRNHPAHTPRATGDWTICEADALDYFSWLSLLHRRLDKAVVALRVPGTQGAHATSWSGPLTFRLSHWAAICSEAMRIAEISAAGQTVCMVRLPLSRRRLHGTRPTGRLSQAEALQAQTSDRSKDKGSLMYAQVVS